MVLVYSQFWVMQITGPVVAVDPAVSASLRNYFFPGYALTIALVLAHLRAFAMGVVRSPLLALAIGVALVSTFWSIDPDVSSRRAVALALTTMSGMAIAVRFAGWPRFLEVLAAAFAILIALCFVIVALEPAYGLMAVDFPGAWRGVWDHKNTLGYNMSVGFVVCAAAAALNPRRRWLWWGFAAGAFALVLLSTSKTALVCCLIAALSIGMIWVSRRGPLWALLAVYLMLTGLCAAGFLLATDPGLVFAALGKDETFTGRTRIWAAVMHQIAKRPWTGYGYGAVWNETSNWGPLPWISKEQGFVIHEAHNSWLGVWLELGYVGLAAAIAVMADACVRTLIGVFRRPSTYFTLPFLAIFLLHSITEAALLAQNDFIWLILSAIVVKLASPEPAVDPVAAPRPAHRARPHLRVVPARRRHAAGRR
jgi:O-antigen ligase